MTSLCGKFNVMRVMVLPVNNNEVLDASGDVELAVSHETEVAGSKKRPFSAGECGAKGLFGFFWPPPIPQRNVGARNPDFSDAAWHARLAGHRIHDADFLTAGGASTADQRVVVVVTVDRWLHAILFHSAARDSFEFQNFRRVDSSGH